MVALGWFFLISLFFLLSASSIFLDTCSKPPVSTNSNSVTDSKVVLENYRETRQLILNAWTISQKTSSSRILDACFRKLFIPDSDPLGLKIAYMENSEKTQVLIKACQDSLFESALKVYIENPSNENALKIKEILQKHGLKYF